MINKQTIKNTSPGVFENMDKKALTGYKAKKAMFSQMREMAGKQEKLEADVSSIKELLIQLNQKIKA